MLIYIVLMTETNEILQIEKRQTGYIYSIRSYHTELVYIGSTFGPLRQRLFQHKRTLKLFNLQKYPYVSSHEIVKYDDAFIELVETYKNVNKMELHKHEGEHIRINKLSVNKKIEGRTKKEWFNVNKEKLKKQRKEYLETHKDKIQEQHKEYCRGKYICECGKSLSNGNKARHDKVCKALDRNLKN